MKRSIYLAAVFLLLSGCMKLKPKDSDKESHDATDVVVTAAVRPSKVSYSILETQEAHQYKVQFNFKEPVSTIALRKTVNEKQTIEWIAVHDQVWVDNNVPPGELVKYEFGQITQEKFDKWDEVILRGPQDLILDKPMSLADEKVLALFSVNKGGLVLDKFYKIFLSGQAVLSLEGKSVRIVAHEISSEGGKIETFPVGAVALPGVRGRSGGQIEIITNKASGTLTVELRGEKGGAGLKGAPADESLRGSKGVRGLNAVMEFSRIVVGEFVPTKYYKCTAQPTSGGPGGKGAIGNRGGDGMPGGSTGRLIYKIGDRAGFNLLYPKTKGEGGEGGPGGPGGVGGEGGDPGEILAPDNTVAYEGCVSALKGPKGQDGDVGPRGLTGAVGSEEPVCEVNAKDEKTCY